MRLLLVSCLVLIAGCTGQIASPSSPMVTPVDPIESQKPDACAKVSAQVGEWPLQRLTSQQIERTVQRVLHDTTHAYAQRLGPTDEVLNTRLRYFLAVSGNSVVGEGLMLAAENVATAAVTNPAMSAQLQCAATDAAGQRACAKTVVTKLGRQLWRRTLSTSEVDGVLAAYDLGRTDATHVEGLQTAIHALLAAPDFFFLQQPQGQSQSTVKLTGTLLAERLAFTLWQEAPDDALLDAAEAGQLDTEAGFTAQLDRLLQDERANLSFAEFLKHWLSPEKTSTIDFALASATRAPMLYPSFSGPSMTSDGDGAAFTRALDGYFARNAVVTTGTLHDLMLDDHLVVNEAVARNLKLPAPAGASLEVRPVDHPRRRGVLGQPAVLAAFGRFEASDPVHRGVFLLRQAMCRPLNPPDMMVNTTLPEATQFKTTRDRFVAATKDQACAGCHAQINPLGFSFENFDAVGAFRDQENGNPVDATATLPILLPATQAPAEVDGLSDLATVLADDAEVRTCLARQFAAFALHRGLTEAEYCAIKPHTDSFSEGKGSFNQLVRGVMLSASFQSPEVP